MTLTAEQFIGRALWHVPEKGMQVIRHYGLYGRCGKAQRDRCRAQLNQEVEQSPKVLTVEQYLNKTGNGEKLCCPVCGEPMISLGRFGRGGIAPGREKYLSTDIRPVEPRSRLSKRISLAGRAEVCFNRVVGAMGWKV